MIKMILLVGFLGAGKTTLMKEILGEYKEQKIGVIVNEFGEINIDAKLIKGDGIKMAELSNGSIFCACIKDKFVDSLIEMSCKDISYLFIEASGLADPANMQTIIDGISKKTLNDYEYGGAICVVDGESFTDLFEVLPAISSQIKYSSTVVINKGDLIDEQTVGEITQNVNQINPSAQIIVTSYCKINIKDVISELRSSEEEASDSSNTVESRPVTFILRGIETGGVIPHDKLLCLLEEVAEKAYRIKGFAKTDKGDVEISCVGSNINVLPWDEEVSETVIVVISSVGFKLISSITTAIDKHAKGYLSM